MKKKIDRINRVLDLLAKNIIASISEDKKDFFLSGGTLGKSLFLYKYGEFKNNENLINLSIQEFEKSYMQIEEHATENGMEFISGYAGIGWVYQYFSRYDLINHDKDFFSLFDEILMEQCRKSAEVKNYDLFYGLIGYGNYFLQRSKYKYGCVNSELNEIVGLLYGFSIKTKDGIVWKDTFFKEKDYINLGMAHGMASLISFLTKLYVINTNILAKKMAMSAVNWLLVNMSNNENSISYFPNNIELNKINTDFSSRIAWCNGDLGIGYAIFCCGKEMGERKFILEGLKILEKCSLKDANNISTGVLDHGICHGSSGIYYIYNKLIIKYKLFEFIEIRDYWLNQIINSNLEISSYYNWTGRVKDVEQYMPNAGLVNGYAGIGLALLSFFESETNDWDDIFLL